MTDIGTTREQPTARDGVKGGPPVTFLLDENLGLTVREKPWSEILSAAGIVAESSTDLVDIDWKVDRHQPDLAFIPIADFHRLIAKEDRHYRGLAIATSKFTGTTNLPSVLVVRKDDPANRLDDLKGSEYGIINRSCSSSYFPPAILLGKQGKKLDDFLKVIPVKAWQGQVDAVVSGQVRVTMLPEDVWKTSPENVRVSKVIGRYDTATPPVVVVREGLDAGIRKTILDALVAWTPRWEGSTVPSDLITMPTSRRSSTTSTDSHPRAERDRAFLGLDG